MKQEEKQLLVKEFCMRLPYGVKIQPRRCQNDIYRLYAIDMENKMIKFWTEPNPRALQIGGQDYLFKYGEPLYKPYLRPMSSMTEEEKEDYQYITERWMYDVKYSIGDSIDWLNEHHFDYRGLIEMGLALEAPEWMY